MFVRRGLALAAAFPVACALAPLHAKSPLPKFPPSAWAAQCKDWDDWDKAGPPFQVAPGIYYVGTCGISAILIKGSDGDVLIDGGPADAAQAVARNIEAVGKLSDVRIILHSHEHHDHVGGIAELQRLTGARLLASPEAAEVFTSGKPSADDPQFAEHQPVPVARVDGTVKDGQIVRLGNLAITAIATPGHTPGALSWQWRVCGTGCDVIVYADSLTPVSSNDYRFADHPAYLAAFKASLARVAGLDCSILLSPHPSASGMRERILAGGIDGGLWDSGACRAYARGLRKKLDERLAKEADGG